MSNMLDKANRIKQQKDEFIVPENLRAGVTALGVTGNFIGLDTSDADATASDIVLGKTAYVDGEKVTGTYEGTTVSNIDLNVFLQESEPERKEGIWIKDGETTVSGTEFLYYDALQEEFIDNRAVRFLRNDINCMGQIIVGDYFYTFGRYSGESKKFNLKTGEATTINTASISSYSPGCSTGACLYNNKIYIFYQYNDYNLYVLCYDILNNTSSTWKICSTSNRNYMYSCVNIYNGKAYFMSLYSYSLYEYSYDFTTGGYTQNQIVDDSSKYSNSYFNNITGNRNEFIYFISRGVLYRLNVTTRGISSYLDLRNGSYLSDTTNCGVYCTSDYIYVFMSGSSKYYKIKFADNSITTHNIGFGLQIKSSKDYNTSYSYEHINASDSIVFDDLSGKLYFRTSNEYYKGNPSCMQLYSEKHLGSNKVVVQLSNSYPFVKMENTTSLYSGFKETYLIKDNVITTDHMMCYGDGVAWNIVKNPHNETCTVTFDADGGTGTFESQTFVCGNRATEPSEIPLKQDLAFSGWYLNDELFDFTRKVLSDITLTAHYVAYQVVDYIETSGAQYIDTGVNFNTVKKLETKYATYTLPSNWDSLAYTEDGGDASYAGGGIRFNTSNQFSFQYGIESQRLSITDMLPVTNTDYTVSLDVPNARVTINESNYALTIGTPNSRHLYLFAINGPNGAVSQYFTGKLYYFKIYDNDTLIREFQPVQLSATEEYCLLDVVNGKLYHNLGDGQFSGEVVSDEPGIEE